GYRTRSGPHKEVAHLARGGLVERTPAGETPPLRLGCHGMEEKPPSERRGRSVRPAFSAPAQPTPEEKPPAPAQRRPAKAAPAVTFQPPSAEHHPAEAP